MGIEVGLKGHHEFVVKKEMLATRKGSGTAEVLASPVMIAEMERTSAVSVMPFLEEGKITVGTNLEIQHKAPTPEGETVYIDTEVIDIKSDGKVFTFKVLASNRLGPIGEGVHDRAIVDYDRFHNKIKEKFNK